VRPTFRIIAAGSDITALVSDRLLDLQITDKAGVESDRLTFTVDDRDQLIRLPRKGVQIVVSLGYVGRSLVRMGRYVVDEVDVSGPARELTVRANAVDMTGGMKAPKERSWDNVTLGTVVRTIAGDHQLTASIAESLASRQLGHVDQTESDMQLLQRLCAVQGATCKVADGRLVVAGRASGQGAGGTNLPAALILARNCASWTATLADRGEYRSVKAPYHDVTTGQRSDATAGSGQPALTLRQSYASQSEAQQAADSKFRVLSRGTGKVSIRGLIGDPGMSAERPATLSGFRQGIDGSDWIIDSVVHKMSGSGYTCDIDLESRE
jgi:phage protein D